MIVAKIGISTLSLLRLATLGVIGVSSAVALATVSAAPEPEPKAPSETAKPAALTPEERDAAVTQLTGSIMNELAALPAKATREDKEATIVFTVDQGNYSEDVISLALNLIGKDAAPEMNEIVANVRLVLLRRKLRGTAALLNTGGGFDFNDFSSPVVGVDNGGGSNYAS